MADAKYLPSIHLSQLLFTGPGLEPIGLTFDRGLTVLYGGSNAGKSYSLQAIDFALGGATPAILDQGAEYDTVMLGITFPDSSAKTLVRSRRGGAITVHDEWANASGDFGGRPGTVMSADHGKGKNGSVSELLLEAIGIRGAKVAETEAGKLIPFSLRHFMPYVAIDETRMFSSDSPTVVSPRNGPTLNKNVLRFIATGQDDSSVVTVPNEAAIKAANGGKVELLEELIADLDQQLKDADLGETDVRRERLVVRLIEQEDRLSAVQRELDDRTIERRDLLDIVSRDRDQKGQLAAMRTRFLELKETYETDIRRLEAIEEGGFLLQRFEDQPCPMCGALPGDQHLPHELGDVDRQHATAQAEIAKIQKDIVGLGAALRSLETDSSGLEFRIAANENAVRGLEAIIAQLRPREAETRTGYLAANHALSVIDRQIELSARRSSLALRRDSINAMKVGRQRAEGLTVGIDGPTGHRVAQVIKEVLDAWEYPAVEAVTWDEQRSDIAINGRPRGQNGKGVKAVFHSAFVVGLMIYCRRNHLPHPGFVVLDSPLVTYRKPIHFKRFGNLEEDEKRVAATSLDKAFYKHLSSLAAIGQVFVIENNDPPTGAITNGKVEMFSGESGSGRQGLFPS